MIRLPIFILLWIPMFAIKFIVMIFGLFMVPLLWRYRYTDYDDLPWWTRPWANPEDHYGRGYGNNSLPLWWVDKYGDTFKEFFRYHAIRNPANGLRSFELLDLTIDPKKVLYKTDLVLARYEPSIARDLGLKTIGYFAWQGYQAGFKYIRIWNDTHHFVMKVGWRVEPADASATHSNIGMEDASFASKFLPYRKG